MISSPGTGLLLLNQFQTLWWAGRPQDNPFPGGSPGRCSPQPHPQGTATSTDGAGAGNRLCCGISPCFEASPWRWQQGAELCTVSQPCSHAAGSSRRAAFLPRAAQSLPEPPTSPSQQLSLCVRAPAGGDQSSAGSVSPQVETKRTDLPFGHGSPPSAYVSWAGSRSTAQPRRGCGAVGRARTPRDSAERAARLLATPRCPSTVPGSESPDTLRLRPSHASLVPPPQLEKAYSFFFSVG